MFVLHHRPAPALAPYIQSIIYYRDYFPGTKFLRIMPDGIVQLLIFIDDSERHLVDDTGAAVLRSMSRTAVTGLQRTQTTYTADYPATAICIRFTAGGFYAFTEIPQTETENRIIDGDLLFGAAVLSLREQIVNCADPKQAVQLAERFLLRQLRETGTAHDVISYMHTHIAQPLPDLVRKTGYSQKHVIHLFKKHIGVSPKYYQRLSRFYGSLWDVHGGSDWAGVVERHGYFDQAHLIKEFNHFAGISPVQYAKANCDFPIFLPLNQPR